MTALKPITEYPEIDVEIYCARNECTVYVDLARVGDVVVDGLKRTEQRGYTHEYEKKFDLDFFRMRLRDSEFKTLSEQKVLKIHTRSYFYEHDQAFVSRKQGEAPEFPAFLFKVELNKNDNSFKSKKFRAVMVSPAVYDADECYTQIKKPEGTIKVTKNRFIQTATQIQPVTHSHIGVTPEQVVSIAVGLNNALFTGKLTFDGSSLTFDFSGNSLGN